MNWEKLLRLAKSKPKEEDEYEEITYTRDQATPDVNAGLSRQEQRELVRDGKVTIKRKKPKAGE